MGSIKIGLVSFFSLTVLFELGTAIVVNIGMDAGKDAWIANLLGCVAGLVLFSGYAYLYRAYPEKPLTGYVRILLGKHAGTVVGTLYVIMFMNIAGRDLRDGSTLLVIATLHNTPLLVVAALMILSCAYVLHKGSEVLARTSISFMGVVLVIGSMFTLLLLLSGEMEWTRIMPVMGDGIMPVLKSVIQENYMFPYGEIFCFTMLMPYLTDGKKGVWVIASAMVLSAILISYVTIVNITVLGIDIVDRSPFPLMSTVSKIALSEFIQRMDILIVMLLIIGVFFKIAVFYGAALIGISDLFGLPYRTMIFPCALIILLSSILNARNFPEHLETGRQLIYTYFPFFSIIIPVILIIITAIRRHRSALRLG